MPKTIFFINSSDYKKRVDEWQSDPYGIYMVDLDTETGKLEIIDRDDTVASTQFFHVDDINHRLYAGYRVSEGVGELLAFDINPSTSQLTYLNREPSGNSAITFVGMSKDKRFVLTINYASPNCVGQVNIFPVAANGRVMPIVQSFGHDGKGIHEKRQDCSHPHMIDTDPSGHLVLIPDLGIDKLMLYDLDTVTGKLASHNPPYMVLPPGSGPRHFTFHPNGRFLYLLNELSATIQSYRYDGSAGHLTPLELLPTLPEDFTEHNTAADIHITPDGKFLYSTNRGHDSLAMFKIEESGELTLLGRESTRGNHPRHFNMDPSGKFLLVGNQHSNTVQSFRINVDTGKLEFTGYEIAIPGPSCIYPYIL